MIRHCKFTLSQKYSFLLSLFIMTFYLPSTSQSSLFITALSSIVLVSFTAQQLYNCVYSSLFSSYTIIIPNDSPHIKNIKKPALLIDTNTTATTTHKYLFTDDNHSQHMMSISPASVGPTILNKSIKKRRHYSVSSRPEVDFLNKTPEISPSVSFVSSFGTNWSQERRNSKVGEMIYLFETGVHQHQQLRRHSVDSHNYKQSQLIRDREFKYKPIASEWKKRDNSPIQLTPSKSTPVKGKMPCILERSRSTLA